MTFDEAAELGAKLTVARAARALQAKESEGQLKTLALLLREEAKALKAFAAVANVDLGKQLNMEASILDGRAQELEALFPGDPA